MWSRYGGRFVSFPGVGKSRELYVEDGKLDRVYRKMFEEVRAEEGWEHHLEEYDRVVAEIMRVSDSVRNASEKSSSELLKLYRDWIRVIVDDMGKFLIFPFAIEKYADPYCRRLLKEELGTETVNQAYEIIASPSELNRYQRMRLDVIEAVLGEGATDERCKSLARAYGWYGEYSYIEPLLDEGHFRREIRSLEDVTAKKERDNIIRDTREASRAFNDLLLKLQRKESKHIATVLHHYTFLRTDRIEYLKWAQVALRNLFQAVAALLREQTGKEWTVKEVAQCLVREIVAFLEDGTIPDHDLISRRISQKYIYYSDENAESHVIYDDDVIGEALRCIVASVERNEDVKGAPAYRGVVSGRVVLVFGKEDFAKVERGDILVTQVTMPEYTPIMRKAAGFVTEEGGITSHAAVVSRELRKPCIVGTGNCTKALHDGDLVEVDADRGVVTMLKRMS